MYVKNEVGNLIGIVLNLQIVLWSIVILTILILPIQEHSIYFHVFVSSFISFINMLQFSDYMSFTYLNRFILKYFILFDAMTDGIVSLISLSDLSLLVYINVRELFCVDFVSCKFTEFLDDFQQLSGNTFRIYYVKYVICKQWQFHFCSIYIPFLSFSSLIAIARASKTVLNKSM